MRDLAASVVDGLNLLAGRAGNARRHTGVLTAVLDAPKACGEAFKLVEYAIAAAGVKRLRSSA